MDEIAETPPVKVKPRRRWWKVIAALALIVAASVAAFPFALSTATARRWLLARADTTLHPGRLEVAQFRFSWFSPTRMTGFVIRDAEGDKVVDCPRAVWDRNLFQILFGRPRLGLLRLDRAAIDVERREDGSIDLADALRPVLTGSRGTDLTIRVLDGTFRVRGGGLAEPIVAERFDFLSRRPPAPGDVSWEAVLDDRAGHSLQIRGNYARWDDKPSGRNGLDFTVMARGWPFAVAAGGVTARATLDGHLSSRRIDGRWGLEGQAALKGLDATGEALSGDRVRLDSLVGEWSLGQAGSGWAIRVLDLRTPVGTLRASGPIPAPAGGSSRITGRLDLAALAAMLPRTLRLRRGLTLDRGDADLLIVETEDAGRRVWTAEARVSGLAAHLDETSLALREPATLTAKVVASDGAVTVDSLAITSAFLKAEGRGDLDRGVTVAGTLDLAGLARQLGDFIDLGTLALSGEGRVTADLKREGGIYLAHASTEFVSASVGPENDALDLEGVRLEGSARGADPAKIDDWRLDAALDVTSARRAGLALESVRVAGSRERGAIHLEPIEATLNGGRLRLLPEFVTEPAPILRLRSGSELIDAEVNEESSRRVLAFIAPILDGATRAKGRVSARLDRAEFPIGAGATRKAEVEGKVVFQDLVFGPGPLATGVLGLLGRSDATLRLDQPVVLSISEGKVHQRGLAVPVGDLTRVELEGSVGFDRSLDLRATVPITPAMFPNGGLIGKVASGSKITVPIRGTLARPQIDRDAFRAGMADLGKGLMLRGAAIGATEMLFRLTRPRDPDAPPPLTREERKAKRQERKAQRRGGW